MTSHTPIHRQLFTERLNQVLSEADFPVVPGERAADFAKIFELDAITAERILDGVTLPSDSLLTAIAEEFEVDATWLRGV
jgi:hypothetical protein